MGASNNFLNWVRPTTLRVTAGSHGVLVERARLQQVVHGFTEFYAGLLAEYRSQRRYPINSGMQIRITGTDDPSEVDVDAAVVPAFSAAAPDPDHPERDTIVWMDTLSLPETPHLASFFTELDRWFAAIDPAEATVRVEWSKRWGYADGVAWRSSEHLAQTKASLPGWDAAVEVLHRHEPHKVFVTDLHELLGID